MRRFLFLMILVPSLVRAEYAMQWPKGEGVCSGPWEYHLYNECRDPSHGVELYKEARSPMCGSPESFQKKTIATSDVCDLAERHMEHFGVTGREIERERFGEVCVNGRTSDEFARSYCEAFFARGAAIGDSWFISPMG